MRIPSSVAGVVALGLALSACGSDDAATDGGSGSGAATFSSGVRADFGSIDAGVPDCLEDKLTAAQIEALNDAFAADEEPAQDVQDATFAALETCMGELAGDDDMADDTDVADDDDMADDDMADGGEEAINTADTAFALGTTATLAGWDITVTDAYAATEVNGQTSEEGSIFVITLTAVNGTGVDGGVFIDLNWGTVAADGTVYEIDCGIALEDDLAFAEDVPDGGTQTGSFCLELPTEVADAVTTFYLSDAFSADQTKAWWTL